MNNTTLTVKTDKKLRNEAKKVAKELGVPLTVAVNAMLRQFVRDRRLVLEGKCVLGHTPNAETQKALAQAERMAGSSSTKSYKSARALFDDVVSS